MENAANTNKRVNKYSYVKVIQQHYGQGWEDNSEYTLNDRELMLSDLKEYRLTGYSTRVINRKVLNV
tara:strand:- start:123 stop:323 length:201 start_codon:yes stop_codon:yes gene_type:complete